MALNLCQNKLSYWVCSISSCLVVPQYKKTKVFQGCYSLNPRSWTCFGNYSTLRPPAAFYNVQKSNLCWKMNISKTAWINDWSWVQMKDIKLKFFINLFLGNQSRYLCCSFQNKIKTLPQNGNISCSEICKNHVNWLDDSVKISVPEVRQIS